MESAISMGNFLPLFEDGIPDDLKPGDKWVCYDGDKVPMVPLIKDRRRASSTDPLTWRPLSAALTAYKTGRYAGVGRVITADEDFVGVDIDDCRNPRTGEITPEAMRIVEGLDSYSETSPTGTGVKVWVRSEELKTAHVKPGLEIYPRGRYFTVTGHFLPQCLASVKNREGELRALISREFPKPRRRQSAFLGWRNRDGDTVLELDKFLEGTNLEIFAIVCDSSATTKYRISCPWIDEHTGRNPSGTYVGQYDNGALFFHCNHAHCRGRKWQDFRLFFEPNCYEPWWLKVVAKNA